MYAKKYIYFNYTKYAPYYKFLFSSLNYAVLCYDLKKSLE